MQAKIGRSLLHFHYSFAAFIYAMTIALPDRVSLYFHCLIHPLSQLTVDAVSHDFYHRELLGGLLLQNDFNIFDPDML